VTGSVDLHPKAARDSGAWEEMSLCVTVYICAVAIATPMFKVGTTNRLAGQRRSPPGEACAVPSLDEHPTTTQRDAN